MAKLRNTTRGNRLIRGSWNTSRDSSIERMAAENITALINKSASSCLNEDKAHPWSNLVGGGGKALALKSDADEQLILTLAFSQTVKITGLSIGLPTDRGSCPRTIKLFINESSLGFDEATEMKALQEFVITDSSPDEYVLKIQALKWTRTDFITIFIVDNHGSSVSSITDVKVYGSAHAGTDVAQIKSC